MGLKSQAGQIGGGWIGRGDRTESEAGEEMHGGDVSGRMGSSEYQGLELLRIGLKCKRAGVERDLAGAECTREHR